MSTFDYDLFVIGGGSGGVRAARIAAGHGAKVGLAEEYRMGGTCVIRGCVPKKLLVYASRFSGEFEEARGFGWSVESAQFDWPTLIANKDKEISRLEGLYKKGLDGAGVDVFETRAVFTSPNTLSLEADGKSISAKHILIATGGRPNVDERLPGVEHVITSNEAFHLPELPKRIVIAGGGYIAVEFAGIFAGLGVQTTLIYRGEKILRGFDDDMRDGVTDAYRADGINIITGLVFSQIEKTPAGVVGTLTDGSQLEADQIMFAIGRSPNTAGLGLEEAGVKTSDGGAVIVDEHSRTNVPHIFAVGDVTDCVQLTPVAIREGHSFADRLFGRRQWNTDYEMIPTAVFSTPEIGTVGYTEAEARERFGDVDIYKSTFRPMKSTLGGGEHRMIMKLIVEPEGERVIGCHIFGPDAGEMVQVAAIAMRLGAKKSDFDATMALHPSAAEELVTMRSKWVPAAS